MGSEGQRQNPRGYQIAVAIAGALIALGTVKAFVETIRPAFDVLRSRDWPAARVMGSEVKVFPFHGIDYADFEFTYMFGGSTYIGHRYSFVHPAVFHDNLFSLQSGLGDICYVNPANPREAVINRELPPRAYGFAGLLAMAGGLLMWFWARRLKKALHSGEPIRGAFLRQFPVWTVRVAAVAAWALAWRFVDRGGGIGTALLAGVHIALGMALWVQEPRSLNLAAGFLMLHLVLGVFAAGITPIVGEDPRDWLHDPGYIYASLAGNLAFSTSLAAVVYFAQLVVRARSPVQPDVRL